GRAPSDGRARLQVSAPRSAPRGAAAGEGGRVCAAAALARLVRGHARAMKVVMVETGGWGGIAHYAWNLCAALAGAGVEVSLLTNREWELRHLPCRFEVDRGFAGDVGYFRNVKALRAQLASSPPDV